METSCEDSDHTAELLIYGIAYFHTSALNFQPDRPEYSADQDKTAPSDMEKDASLLKRCYSLRKEFIHLGIFGFFLRVAHILKKKFPFLGRQLPVCKSSPLFKKGVKYFYNLRLV